MKVTVVSICFMATLLASDIAGDQLENKSRMFEQDAVMKGFVPKLFESKFKGGSNTSWDEYPYVVIVLNNNEVLCGGEIISEESILTSQDNVLDVKAEDLIVFAFMQPKNVSYIIMQDTSKFGALAVLKLETKLDFSESKIAAIELGKEVASEDSNCTVSGTGRIGLIDEIVRYAAVPTVKIAECENAWDEPLDEGYLCTGSYETYKDLCRPNVGDPLVCEEVLIGIATTNNLCDSDELPGIYTSVAHHNSWIVEQMKKPSSTTSTSTSTTSTSTPTTSTATSTTSTTRSTTTPSSLTTPSSATSNRQNHIALLALISAALGVLFRKSN